MKTRERILGLLSRYSAVDGPQAAWLAKLTGIKKASVRKALQRLEKEGLVKGVGRTTGRYYVLSQAVSQAVPSPKPVSSQSHIPSRQASTPHATLTHRLHRLQFSRAITSAVSEDRLRALKLNDKLNNIKQFIGVHFRISVGRLNRVLELEGIEQLSDASVPVPFLEAQALTLCMNATDRIASLYGFTLAKEGIVPPKLTEIELNATQLTDRLKDIEKKGIVPLFTDQNGYSIWVDWSWGIGGLESNNPLYSQRLANVSIDIARDDMWELMKARQDMLDKQAERTSATLLEYATQLNAHLPVLAGMKETQDKVNALLDRLNDQYPHPKPRRTLQRAREAHQARL